MYISRVRMLHFSTNTNAHSNVSFNKPKVRNYVTNVEKRTSKYDA